MNFEQNISSLFSDIDLPEVFITEHLSTAKGDYVKIYLYCLFLCKHNGEISLNDLSKKLNLPLSTIEEGIKYWTKESVLSKKDNTYLLADLKQQEISKMYKPKLTTSLEDAIKNTEKNVTRTQTINAINGMFFQGVMSPTWYTDIDLVFSKYNFDDDVVIALFQYCSDRNALNRNYLMAVADGWAKSEIHTIHQLDEYYSRYEKLIQMKRTISKKLGISRKLTQYEEAYVDKWVMDFGYPLNVIEIALKKTTSKANPSFDYIDKIISDWHERNLKTETEVNSFIETEKKKRKEFKAQTTGTLPNTLQKFNDASNSQYSDLSKFYMN